MAEIICKSLGIEKNKIKQALQIFPGVPGRLQKHTLKNGSHTFVDFAHNPSSMEAVLKTLRPLTNNLIIVFGCGGDKDKTKRPIMGNLAHTYGDVIILTDDNPRGEDRHKIIDEIEAGITNEPKKTIIREPDRAKSIALAAQMTNSNSIIALLGKGHETHYISQGQEFYFDDFQTISAY